MEIFEGCLSCLLEQAKRTSKMARVSAQTEQKILSLANEILKNYKNYENSPHLAQHIYETINTFLKQEDPFKEVKEKDIALAESLVPTLKDFIASSQDNLYAALKVGAVGNNLDSAIVRNIDINAKIHQELNAPFKICDIDILREKLKTAKTVLIIGDNSGEAVFDGVFMDNFPNLSFYYAVRSAHTINDITLKEATAIGINKKAKVFASGSCAPGSVLSQCSKEFKKLLNSADIVLSKGQGNYECLTDIKGIFFLLKAKCPVIASHLCVDIGSYILKYNK